MKLTKKDKQLLISIGYEKKDFLQIEQATSKTVYEHYPKMGVGWKITMQEAIDILGKKEFLSGIARSAFHWSAIRLAPDGSEVYLIVQNCLLNQ